MASRNRSLSYQSLAVLQCISDAREEWSYGLEISKSTGLKSGSLYPILMRLNERGLLESCWLEPERLGRPPRHGYRITTAGIAELSNAQRAVTVLSLKEA